MKNMAVYGLGSVLSRFIGVLTVPVYTRLLSVEEYGQLDFYIGMAALLMLLSELQISSGFSRSFFREKKENRLNQLIGNSLGLYFLTQMVFLVVFFLISISSLQESDFFRLEFLLPIVLKLFPEQILHLAALSFRLEEKPFKFTAIILGQVLKQ